MKTAVLKIGIFILNVIYTVLKVFPQDGRIVFISRQSDTPTLDFRLLRERLAEDSPQTRTVMLTKRLNKGLKSKLGYAFHMLSQMYHFARAGAVVLDSYCIAVSVLKHRKGLFVLQIWHAIGSMKKFGYAMLGKEEGSSAELAKVMRMHKNYDLAAISSMSFVKDYEEGFGITRDHIIEIPLPRADLLTDKEYAAAQKARLTKKYPMLAERTNILYCPTFRKDDRGVKEAVERLIAAFDTDKYNFIICMHPLCPRYEFRGNILRPKESTFEMLFAADHVISDYSSIIYEAGLLGLPIYSYAYDWQDYSGKREINFDIAREFPGIFTEDPEAVRVCLEQTAYDFDALKAFTARNVTIPQEGCAAALSALLLQHAKCPA